MTVLEDSVRVGTRLAGLVDIACAVHRPDIPAMLVEWLGGRPDGHCIVDCTDDFQVVYTNQAAGTWAGVSVGAGVPSKRIRAHSIISCARGLPDPNDA